MLKRLRGKGAKKNEKLLTNVTQNIDPELIWRKGRQIGQGAVGTVYQVLHTVNGLKAAVRPRSIQIHRFLQLGLRWGLCRLVWHWFR